MRGAVRPAGLHDPAGPAARHGAHRPALDGHGLLLREGLEVPHDLLPGHEAVRVLSRGRAGEAREAAEAVGRHEAERVPALLGPRCPHGLRHLKHDIARA